MDEQEIRRSEREKVLRAVGTWLELRNRHKNNQPTTKEDLEHSALLVRLLSGEKQFDVPPPRRFGNPDYDLAAGKEIEVEEVSAWRGTLFDSEQIAMKELRVGDQVQIDRGHWDVIECHTDHVVIQWPESPSVFYTLRHDGTNWKLVLRS